MKTNPADVSRCAGEMSRLAPELSRLAGHRDGDIGGGHGGTSPFRGDVPARCPDCPGTNVPTNVPAQCPDVEAAHDGRGSKREAMPKVAEIVDWLRRELGADVVDKAIRCGMALQRRHAAVVAERGEECARQWLAQQRMPGGSFWAQEGDQTVGVRRP